MKLTKNTFIKFGLTAFAALVVSACGSSGGDNSSDQQNNASNNTQPSQPTNNSQTNTSNPSSNQSQQTPNGSNELVQQNNASNNNQTSQPTNNSQTNTSNLSSNQSQQTRIGTGAAIVISGKDENVPAKIKTISDYDTIKINVEGTPITIGSPNISISGWSIVTSRNSGNHFEVCCGKYSDIRFGISAPNKDITYIFYNGNPTQSMPTSGTATYSGNSIITAYTHKLDDKDYDIGSSKFTVDFGNKTLNGSLEIKNIQPVNINATISGNSFAGRANSASLPSSGAVEGKFYGNNAKEMAGLAQGDDKSWGAAFGAAKQ